MPSNRSKMFETSKSWQVFSPPPPSAAGVGGRSPCGRTPLTLSAGRRGWRVGRGTLPGLDELRHGCFKRLGVNPGASSVLLRSARLTVCLEAVSVNGL